MLGSDLPIERLRSGFEPLYRAYEEIFAGHTARPRDAAAGHRGALVRDWVIPTPLKPDNQFHESQPWAISLRSAPIFAR
jgi:hypothetical protein